MTSEGDRIELIATRDPHSTLKPGTQGTVKYIDVLGTIHVQWDTGSRLGLVPDEDEWKLIK